ncbi:beta-lactamase/transpeptidase-like protein [Ophiobolus disseminans]|uniref:Beta-lactamase/transpeptidase-like protein n=1 Tax=Ophiobolus disseminans TaxID=1469910 RepID=A0A6A7AHG6_9PLEO|nr:beta-lactamase/transpeptidase-like protein [Ophiobolus disseminans]
MRPSFVLSCAFVGLASATAYCPLLGPVFPAPKSLFTSAPFQASLKSLEASLVEAFSTGNSSNGPVNSNDTYSIQIFSTKDERPLFDFHRRGADLVGEKTINGDSIYRIASTTKLITVYMMLLQAGDGIFNDPVTKHLPELAGQGYWDEITIGTLAGNMGGIVSDIYNVDSLTGGGLGAAFPDAFPPLNGDEMSPCTYGESGCTRKVILDHVTKRRQVFLPNSTPGYTNMAFAILTLVLESITGLSYADSLRKLLVAPLKLTGTTSSTPLNASRGVIVGDETASQWDLILDDAGTGMGAMFSTANDMSKIGRGVLASTFLPTNTTRAWLKPTSHTSSLIGAIGRPWEIYRATLGPSEHNRVVDMFTKGGNVGGFGANLVLVPDYDVGFVALMAGRRGTVSVAVANIIAEELLPALEEAARIEADNAFAGAYRGSDGLNSSLVLSSKTGVPGLAIDSWISNGTDILRDVYGSPKSFELYPTNILSEDGKRYSWRSTFLSSGGSGPFSACPSWGGLDRPTYGVYGLDEFVFHVDESGKATAVEPKALKIVLERV